MSLLLCFNYETKYKATKLFSNMNPVDTGRKLNVHKTFRRRPGRLLNLLCTFNVHPVSTGKTTRIANMQCCVKATAALLAILLKGTFRMHLFL